MKANFFPISGLPDSSDSVVRTAEDIVKMFRNYRRATSVIVIMAQPMTDQSDSIRICSFATDNKFTTEDVRNRLDFIIKELKREDIRVLAYSADGDSRELKMMRQRISLGVPLPPSQKIRSSYFPILIINLFFYLKNVFIVRACGPISC